MNGGFSTIDSRLVTDDQDEDEDEDEDDDDDKEDDDDDGDISGWFTFLLRCSTQSEPSNAAEFNSFMASAPSHHQNISVWLKNVFMLVKPCHKPPKNRNGNLYHRYIYGDDWGMVYDCFMTISFNHQLGYIDII